MISILTSALVLLSLNKPDGVYSAGDTVKIYATKGDEVTLVHEEVCKPGAQNIRFDYEDTCIGWVVDPEEYVQALPCPKDFNRYWNEQKRIMRKLPINPELKEINVPGYDNEKYVCYEVTLDCINHPVRGYLAMPRNAARKSLPIVIFAHAAGVAGNWCRAHAEEAMIRAAWGNGTICIDINAFGMLNDAPQAYFDIMEQTEFKNYSVKGSETREGYFFRTMYLRMVRALDYVCSLPEWDGKRVMAYGQSQGGNQAFAVAGLDKRVTAVVGIVPGGCNNYGKLVYGGADSWPVTYKAFMTSDLAKSILPYYDCCNFIAQSKAELFVEIGLMDTTCRPASIYSALNANRKSVKTVITSPWRYHNEPDARYWDEWKNSIYKQRMEFVQDYLK
ncbi:MAG: acetylxylan esterase [Bacteroidales bacterium]|nr:acetylxylan esterase [Bacteroidales bacterium]